MRTVYRLFAIAVAGVTVVAYWAYFAYKMQCEKNVFLIVLSAQCTIPNKTQHLHMNWIYIFECACARHTIHECTWYMQQQHASVYVCIFYVLIAYGLFFLPHTLYCIYSQCTNCSTCVAYINLRPSGIERYANAKDTKSSIQ